MYYYFGVSTSLTRHTISHGLHRSDTYLPVSSPLPEFAPSIWLTDSVLGDMLIHERDIRRKPPRDPEAILDSLKKVRIFQSRLKAILDGLPRVFQFHDEQENVYVPRLRS
jgi:hypothetical protein